jgi:hypothetical protein
MSIDPSDPSVTPKPQYANFERESNRPPRPISYPYQEGDAADSVHTARGPTAPVDDTHISSSEPQTQSPPPPPISASNSNSTGFTAPTSITRTSSSASPTSSRITRTPSLRPGTHLPVQPANGSNGHPSCERSANEHKVLFYGTSSVVFILFLGTSSHILFSASTV